MGLTPIPYLIEEEEFNVTLSKKTCSRWVQKSATREIWLAWCMERSFWRSYQAKREIAAFLQGIADKHDYIKLFDRCWDFCLCKNTLVPYFKEVLTNTVASMLFLTTDIVANPETYLKKMWRLSCLTHNVVELACESGDCWFGQKPWWMSFIKWLRVQQMVNWLFKLMGDDHLCFCNQLLLMMLALPWPLALRLWSVKQLSQCWSTKFCC